MSGAGLAADTGNNIYFLAGNGTFDTTLTTGGFPINHDFGNSFMKLSTAGNVLTPIDYFATYNTPNQNSQDLDLGSGGALVLPDMTDAQGLTRQLAVGAGKDQAIYLVDRSNMGKFNSVNDNAIYQKLSGTLPGGVWAMPAYFNGTLYYGSVGNPLKAFQFQNARLASSSSQTSGTFGYPGTTPSISANGNANGIVWAAENLSPAVLHAFAATNLANELYNSAQAANDRDRFGAGNKFITPTIANGQVYVGTTTGVGVFGLLNQSIPTIALSSPPNGASYTAPATINLAASVTANGHSITKVQFYNGTSLLGEAATAPYSFTWRNVGVGGYSLSARLVYDSGSTLDSSPINIDVTSLPLPWQTTDIGSPGVSASASASGEVYTVNGAGNISGSADNFRFVYQSLSADGEIRAQISSVQNSNPNGYVGVMIRESLTSSSAYGMMGLLSDGTARFQVRANTSGNPWSRKLSGVGVPPNIWVRLVRTGTDLYGYTSTDGVNWGGAVTRHHIAMASNIYIGLAVASGTPNTLTTATFNNVTAVP